MIAIKDAVVKRTRVQEICSLLVANGHISKSEFPDLMYDEDLRDQVTECLDMVGLRLLENRHCQNLGVGLAPTTAADDRLNWSNNFGLDRGALALLLILWCKLILPKRMHQQSQSTENGGISSLFPEMEIASDPTATINRDQVIAEFSELLGGGIITAKYLAQLSRANLIKSHGGLIEEGPLLALAVDEQGLTDELHREVLVSVLKREKRKN